MVRPLLRSLAVLLTCGLAAGCASLRPSPKSLALQETEARLQLAAAERRGGRNSLAAANAAINLGIAQYAQGSYAEAKALFRRALTIREKALGPDHPNVAHTLANLAETLQGQARYVEADLLYRRAATVIERALGLKRPDVMSA